MYRTYLCVNSITGDFEFWQGSPYSNVWAVQLSEESQRVFIQVPKHNGREVVELWK